VAALAGDPFMTGQWTTLDLPGTPELKLGTPLLFDLGVAMVVVGVGVTILVSLASEGRHDD
jgi:multicomponent Na+:H+ antiporter subunit B